MVYHKSFPAGYIHFCIFGKGEGRMWSNNDLKTRFNIQPQIGQHNFAPIFNRPYLEQLPDLSHLSKSTDSWLLILIHHLQEDLFFAGYTEFFRDFKTVFPLFDRVTFGIQSDEDVYKRQFMPSAGRLMMFCFFDYICFRYSCN